MNVFASVTLTVSGLSNAGLDAFGYASGTVGAYAHVNTNDSFASLTACPVDRPCPVALIVSIPVVSSYDTSSALLLSIAIPLPA